MSKSGGTIERIFKFPSSLGKLVVTGTLVVALGTVTIFSIVMVSGVGTSEGGIGIVVVGTVVIVGVVVVGV